MPLTTVLVQSEDELIVFQCSISHGVDCRHPYTADVRAFLRLCLTLCSREGMGHFAKHCLQATLLPVCGMIQERCQRKVRVGGTVRFLHVEGMVRHVGLSYSFMSAPGVHSGSLISCRNEG